MKGKYLNLRKLNITKNWISNSFNDTINYYHNLGVHQLEEIQPPHITIENNITETTIIRKNFQPQAFFFLIFSIFWIGFLIKWYSNAFSFDAPLEFKLFPLIHVTVGLYISYTTVTMFINRIKIIVTPYAIEIKDLPLPLGNTKSVELVDVANFYPYENSSIFNKKNTFSVYIKKNNEKDKKIIRGLYTYQESKFIASKLNELTNKN